MAVAWRFPDSRRSIGMAGRSGLASGKSRLARKGALSGPPRRKAPADCRSAPRDRAGRRRRAEKGREQLAHGALGQVAGDEHEPGAVVVVRPALQPRRSGGRRAARRAPPPACRAFRRACTMPFRRSSLAPWLARSSSRNISSVPAGIGGVGGEHEGGDMLVMAVEVVMMVMAIVAVGIGFRRQPFLHVGDFALRIVQAAIEQRARRSPRLWRHRGSAPPD